MDDKEPDHGYGGPAGGGVRFPGGLVTSNDDGDDHVTVEDQSVIQILIDKKGLLDGAGMELTM